MDVGNYDVSTHNCNENRVYLKRLRRIEVFSAISRGMHHIPEQTVTQDLTTRTISDPYNTNYYVRLQRESRQTSCKGRIQVHQASWERGAAMEIRHPDPAGPGSVNIRLAYWHVLSLATALVHCMLLRRKNSSKSVFFGSYMASWSCLLVLVSPRRHLFEPT